MTKSLIVVPLLFLSIPILSQNCQAFLYYGDTMQYEACVIAEERAGHYQYSRAYQEALDRAIDKCYYFADAYRHKSVAYLKSGDFINWKRLMDQAVKYKPADHLGNRGWCRFQFFRDYKGAISDIELLDSLVSYDIGYSVNGEYHLQIARAICYKALGNLDKAIEIIKSKLEDPTYIVGPYDYLHLGCAFLLKEDYVQAEKAFARQSEINILAESQFYLSLVLRQLKRFKESKKCLLRAKELYEQGDRMTDPYTNPEDKIFLSQILEELAKLSGGD